MTCGTGSVCCIVPSGTSFTSTCTAAGACVDGGSIAACDGPEDCSGGASCCAAIDLLGNIMQMGGDGGVGASGGGAMCTADCTAGLDPNNRFQTRLCHAAGDCTGLIGSLFFAPEPFDKCCTRGRLSEHVCVPTTADALAPRT